MWKLEKQIPFHKHIQHWRNFQTGFFTAWSLTWLPSNNIFTFRNLFPNVYQLWQQNIECCTTEDNHALSLKFNNICRKRCAVALYKCTWKYKKSLNVLVFSNIFPSKSLKNINYRPNNTNCLALITSTDTITNEQ